MATEGRCCAFIVTFFIYSEEMKLNKRKKINFINSSKSLNGKHKNKALVLQSKTKSDTEAKG